MGRPKIYDETLREKLLDEAGRMLDAEGYHAVSLRVVTKNVGTSTNAVYTLFGSKEAMMSEVIVRGMRQRMEAASDRSSDLCPVARAMYMTGYYRVSVLCAPKRYRGLFDATKEIKKNESVLGRIDPGLFKLGTRVFEPLLEAAEALVATKGIDEDPQVMACSFWGAVHGLIELETEGLLSESFTDVPRLYVETLDRLYRGWVGEPMAEEHLACFERGQIDTRAMIENSAA